MESQTFGLLLAWPRVSGVYPHAILEGVDKLDLSNKNPQIHQTDHVDFVTVMEGLGRYFQPLRIRDDIWASLTQEGQIGESAEWLQRRLRDGYLLKPYTSLAGARSAVLFRGHLSATLPVKTATSVKPWSKTGVDLEVRDSRTGLVDITYRSAWQLGRLLAIGDPSFSISLLRLRGQIHAEARSLPIMDQAEAPADMDNVVNNPQYYNKVHDVTCRLSRGKDTTSSYNEWNGP
ncbi:hypothetical protein CSHISOI_03230, partial [Colletotrichum shisoi]